MAVGSPCGITRSVRVLLTINNDSYLWYLFFVLNPKEGREIAKLPLPLRTKVPKGRERFARDLNRQSVGRFAEGLLGTPRPDFLVAHLRAFAPAPWA